VDPVKETAVVKHIKTLNSGQSDSQTFGFNLPIRRYIIRISTSK